MGADTPGHGASLFRGSQTRPVIPPACLGASRSASPRCCVSLLRLLWLVCTRSPAGQGGWARRPRPGHLRPPEEARRRRWRSCGGGRAGDGGSGLAARSGGRSGRGAAGGLAGQAGGPPRGGQSDRPRHKPGCCLTVGCGWQGCWVFGGCWGGRGAPLSVCQSARTYHATTLEPSQLKSTTRHTAEEGTSDRSLCFLASVCCCGTAVAVVRGVPHCGYGLLRYTSSLAGARIRRAPYFLVLGICLGHCCCDSLHRNAVVFVPGHHNSLVSPSGVILGGGFQWCGSCDRIAFAVS